MSLTRIHNLSISLDGFATGEPQSADAPFGHAGERLHEWMFGTRFWDAGGTAGVDDAVGGQRIVPCSWVWLALAGLVIGRCLRVWGEGMFAGYRMCRCPWRGSRSIRGWIGRLMCCSSVARRPWPRWACRRT
jgi:hypothetical protein